MNDCCRYLAKQYALSKDAIANGLPLIDTTKSLVEQYCPPFLMTPKCEVQRWELDLLSLWKPHMCPKSREPVPVSEM